MMKARMEVEEIPIHEDSNHELYVAERMNLMREKGHFVDVIIVCGKRNFPAHRIVLCSRSAFFKRFLQDTDTRTLCTIHMKDVGEAILEILLEFIYTGLLSIPSHLTMETLMQLMTAAQKMEVEGAVSSLCAVVMQRNEMRSVLALWDWATEFHQEGVEQKVIAYIVRNLRWINQKNELAELSPKRLIAVVGSIEMQRYESFDQMAVAAVQWLKVDPEKRQTFVTDIAHCMDFNKISHECARHLVATEPLFRDIVETSKKHNLYVPHVSSSRTSPRAVGQVQPMNPPGGSTHALSASKSHSNWRDPVVTQQSMTNTAVLETRSHSAAAVRSSRSRFKTPSPLVCDRGEWCLTDDQDGTTDWGGTGTAASVEACRRCLDDWKLSSTPEKMVASVITFDEAIHRLTGGALMVVGIDDMNRFVLYLYLPEQRVWSMAREVDITCRQNMMYAYTNGNLFVFGGEDTHAQKHGTVFIYNFAMGTIKIGEPMRVARCSAGVGVHREQVFVVGGKNRFGNAMTHVEYYDTIANKWHIVPALKEKRHFPGVVANASGHVYCVGGYTNRCEGLEPMGDTWQEFVSLPTMFKDTAMFATLYNDYVYSFGNFKPDRVCCLDPLKNELHVLRVCGQIPDEIVSFVNAGKEFWALDKSGRLYVYDVDTFKWEKSLVCPKSLQHPLFLTVVNLDDLKQRR